MAAIGAQTHFKLSVSSKREPKRKSKQKDDTSEFKVRIHPDSLYTFGLINYSYETKSRNYITIIRET